MPSRITACLVVAAILFVVLLVLWPFLRPVRMPLAIVSFDTNIQVASVVCTFGTNHVYYYGDSWDRFMDPLITRLDDTDAYRLRCSTESQATVVWVRFVHSEYEITPPPLTGQPERFRADLTDSNGVTIPLQSVHARMQSYQRGFYVTGWSVPGALETYRGNLIRISSTNGNEAVTLRVP